MWNDFSQGCCFEIKIAIQSWISPKLSKNKVKKLIHIPKISSSFHHISKREKIHLFPNELQISTLFYFTDIKFTPLAVHLKENEWKIFLWNSMHCRGSCFTSTQIFTLLTQSFNMIIHHFVNFLRLRNIYFNLLINLKNSQFGGV